MADQENTQNEAQKAWTLSQDETNYVPLSLTRGKACANCRWFNPNGDYYYETSAASCHLVSSWPESILATGYCDRHEIKAREDLKPEPLEVVIVEPDDDDEMIEVRSQKPSAIKRVFNAMKDALLGDSTPGFDLFEYAGKTHWVARHTNNFEDLEGEILSEKSHDDYISRVDMGLVPLPELWLLHIPGTKHGQALKVMRDDHIVFAIGEFDDSDLAKSLIKYYRKHRKDIELSHGFMHPSWALKDGVYTSYNTFEITTLPTEVAMGANPYTTFEEVIAMTVSPEQRAWMEKTIGKEQTETILSGNEKQNKALEAAGAKFKDFAQVAQDEKQPADARVGALAKMVVEMVESHFESAQQIDQMKTQVEAGKGLQAAYETLSTQHKTLADDYKALKARVEKDASEAPRRASVADETKVEGEIADQIKGQLPVINEEESTFWSVPIKEQNP